LLYNTKVNYDGSVGFPPGVWLIHTSIKIVRNDTNWFPNKDSECSIVVSYDCPAVGGNMIHSTSETYYYVYSNIPTCVVQICPICLIVKEPLSKVLPNYIFNTNNNIIDTVNGTKSTITWKCVCTKIA
jgi:hypothetical protein